MLLLALQAAYQGLCHSLQPSTDGVRYYTSCCFSKRYWRGLLLSPADGQRHQKRLV
jgi:hypothetical protein